MATNMTVAANKPAAQQKKQTYPSGNNSATILGQQVQPVNDFTSLIKNIQSKRISSLEYRSESDGHGGTVYIAICKGSKGEKVEVLIGPASSLSYLQEMCVKNDVSINGQKPNRLLNIAWTGFGKTAIDVLLWVGLPTLGSLFLVKGFTKRINTQVEKLVDKALNKFAPLNETLQQGIETANKHLDRLPIEKAAQSIEQVKERLITLLDQADLNGFQDLLSEFLDKVPTDQAKEVLQSLKQTLTEFDAAALSSSLRDAIEKLPIEELGHNAIQLKTKLVETIDDMDIKSLSSELKQLIQSIPTEQLGQSIKGIEADIRNLITKIDTHDMAKELLKNLMTNFASRFGIKTVNSEVT